MSSRNSSAKYGSRKGSHTKDEPEDDNSPEDFSVPEFFSTIDNLFQTLTSDIFRSFDPVGFEVDELKEVISNVTACMHSFRTFCTYSQGKLEKLRKEMLVVKDTIYKHIERPREEEVSSKGAIYGLQVRRVNQDLSIIAEALVHAAKASADAELAAIEAAEIAEKAAEEAKKMEVEYEAIENQDAENKKREEEERKKREEEEREERERRIKEEDEERERQRREQEAELERQRRQEEEERERMRREEEERLEQERRQREEEERAERERMEEEERQAEQVRQAKMKWPLFTYDIEDLQDFNRGIGCAVKADPEHFNQDMITCKMIPMVESTNPCNINDELVSNIVQLEETNSFESYQHEICVLIPYSSSRTTAAYREPVIKAETPGGWIDLETQEVHVNEHKDLKFVQTDLKTFTKMAVVTRFKTDHLTIPKRGGTVQSSVDPRVTFTVPRGCFNSRKHLKLQLQLVDSTTVNDIRSKPEGKDLFATSSVICSDFDTHAFNSPITVTVHIPPNPVRAKRAAETKAAKEAKMKNPSKPVILSVEELQAKEKKEKGKGKGKSSKQTSSEVEQTTKDKPTKWYMGQYGSQEEDENDQLFLTYKNKNEKWHCVKDNNINQIRMDTAEFQVDDPSFINKFLVLRMKPNSDDTDARNLANIVESKLSERSASIVLRQRSDNMKNAILEVISPTKLEKAIERLNKEGYIDGPSTSKNIILNEGDRLGLGFTSNIKNANDDRSLDFMFNSQLTNSIRLDLAAVNKYLQKNHNYYNGCVQLLRKTPVWVKKEKPKKKSIVQKKTDDHDDQNNNTDEDLNQEEVKEDEESHYLKWNSEVLQEYQINIPKDDDSSSHVAIHKAPVSLSDRVVNAETLHTIATELGPEWQRVSEYLRVSKTRIQSILRNASAHEKGEDDVKFEMLMNWAKKVPKGIDKVSVLGKALTYAGRQDLAAHLKEIQENYQQERKSPEQ